MPSGGLYNPYHLLQEPETTIDPTGKSSWVNVESTGREIFWVVPLPRMQSSPPGLFHFYIFLGSGIPINLQLCLLLGGATTQEILVSNLLDIQTAKLRRCHLSHQTQAPATPCTTSTVEGVGNGGVWPFTLRASKPRMAQARRRTGRPETAQKRGKSGVRGNFNRINLDNQYGNFEGLLFWQQYIAIYIYIFVYCVLPKTLENEWSWWRLKTDSASKN